MRLLRRHFGAGAFTLIELLCVIAIIGTLAALLLPSLSRGTRAARRIQCVTQLQQIGLAFNSFAHDHNSSFPMAVPRAGGGSLEFVQNAYRIDGDFYFGFRHLQVLSNYLVTPKPLVCPADTRLAAGTYEELNNENVSYFVGVSASPDRPMSVLAGDRNVVLGGKDETLLRVSPGTYLRWDGGMHGFRGNLLFADGHVEQRHNFEFAAPQLAANTPSTDLVLPSARSNPPVVANPGSAPSFGEGQKPEPARQPYGAAPGTEPPRKKPAVFNQKTGTREPAAVVSVPPREDPRQPTARGHETNAPESKPSPATSAEEPAEPQVSWFSVLLAEAMEPLLREAGLSLYLLLLVIVCATLAVRRWLTRKTGATRVGRARWR